VHVVPNFDLGGITQVGDGRKKWKKAYRVMKVGPVPATLHFLRLVPPAHLPIGQSETHFNLCAFMRTNPVHSPPTTTTTYPENCLRPPAASIGSQCFTPTTSESKSSRLQGRAQPAQACRITVGGSQTKLSSWPSLDREGAVALAN
jgi:hypothetical protein